MKKNVVKINENALKKIVAESVKNVLREETVKSGSLSNQLGDISLMAKYLQQKSWEMDENGDIDGKDELYAKVFPIMRDLWRVAHSYGY